MVRVLAAAPPVSGTPDETRWSCTRRHPFEGPRCASARGVTPPDRLHACQGSLLARATREGSRRWG